MLLELNAYQVVDDVPKVCVTQDGVIASHSHFRYLCSSAVNVHVSHAYRDKENTIAHQSLTLYFTEMVLTLHMVFS